MSELPIDDWDSVKAVEMAKSITERHGAKPYGFRFRTRLVAEPIPDGRGGTLKVEAKAIATTGTYFITGTIRTIEQVAADNIDSERILRSNMECNRMAYVVQNKNSYLTTMEFDEGDFVVDATGQIIERGNSPERMEYRAKIEETVARLRSKSA